MNIESWARLIAENLSHITILCFRYLIYITSFDLLIHVSLKMKVLHVVLVLASCLLAAGSPIIKVKSRLNEFISNLIRLERDGSPKDYRKDRAPLIPSLGAC